MKTTKILLRLLLVVLAMMIIKPVNAQRCAVLEFKAGVGISQTDVDGISAIFITYFRPYGYTMVERTQIDKVIDEQGFQRSKMTQAQMVRVGEILNVSKIVVGDINVVMGQYNVDVRVINVETGTIAATEGATFATSSYRSSMQSVATKLASKIAITSGVTVQTSTPKPSEPTTLKSRNKVEILYGYLKIFPNELGVFESEPTSVIAQINKQVQHGYNNWRIPTNEELSLLRANNYLSSGTYMTRESKHGIVLLVTDGDDYATVQEAELERKNREEIERQAQIMAEKARKEREERERQEREKQECQERELRLAEIDSVVLLGGLRGVFSCSDKEEVYFSKGNLQYQASTRTWRFAENQWEYVGTSNKKISSYYSGWIDLFGWGTSGYAHRNTMYQPWSDMKKNHDESEAYKKAYDCSYCNLYDDNGQADWGYNAISNGGNKKNIWRTLTKEEWQYILFVRHTSSGVRFVKAKVNDVNGVILLPDDWSVERYHLNSINKEDANYDSNQISINRWINIFETNGAVFLPAAGRRMTFIDSPSRIDYCGSTGYYWSSTNNQSKDHPPYYMFFGDGGLGVYDNGPWWDASDGYSVRLVCSANWYKMEFMYIIDTIYFE